MRSHGAFHRRAASKPTMCAPMLSQRNGAILNPAKKYGKSLGKHENSCTKQRPCARFMQSRGDAPSDIERTGSAAIKAQSVLFGRVNSSPWTSKVRVLRVCLVCSYE